MQLVMWIILGAVAAWFARRLAGARDSSSALGPIVAGALGAAALGVLLGRAGPPDVGALWRVTTVFVGAIGVLVMVKLSTGGRLR